MALDGEQRTPAQRWPRTKLNVTKDHSGAVEVGWNMMKSTSIAIIEALSSSSVVADPLDAKLCTGKQLSIHLPFLFPLEVTRPARFRSWSSASGSFSRLAWDRLGPFLSFYAPLISTQEQLWSCYKFLYEACHLEVSHNCISFLA